MFALKICNFHYYSKNCKLFKFGNFIRIDIDSYVNQKKELQRMINDITENEENANYTDLFNFFDSQNYRENKKDKTFILSI